MLFLGGNHIYLQNSTKNSESDNLENTEDFNDKSNITLLSEQENGNEGGDGNSPKSGGSGSNNTPENKAGIFEIDPSGEDPNDNKSGKSSFDEDNNNLKNPNPEPQGQSIDTKGKGKEVEKPFKPSENPHIGSLRDHPDSSVAADLRNNLIKGSEGDPKNDHKVQQAQKMLSLEKLDEEFEDGSSNGETKSPTNSTASLIAKDPQVASGSGEARPIEGQTPQPESNPGNTPSEGGATPEGPGVVRDQPTGTSPMAPTNSSPSNPGQSPDTLNGDEGTACSKGCNCGNCSGCNVQ